MTAPVIPPEAVSAAARVLASTTVRVAGAEWTHQAYAREALIAAAPAILAANRPTPLDLLEDEDGAPYPESAQAVFAVAVRDAETRGAVKALRAEAQRGYRAAEAFRHDSLPEQRKGRLLLINTAKAIEARADQIESGEVTL